MYRTAKYVTKDSFKAVEWYRRAAEQGHALAQFYLGLAYDLGQGVPADAVKAVEWYGKVAEQGHTFAQNNLANMYLDGRGVPKAYSRRLNGFVKPLSRDVTARNSTSVCCIKMAKRYPRIQPKP